MAATLQTGVGTHSTRTFRISHDPTEGHLILDVSDSEDIVASDLTIIEAKQVISLLEAEIKAIIDRAKIQELRARRAELESELMSVKLELLGFEIDNPTVTDFHNTLDSQIGVTEDQDDEPDVDDDFPMFVEYAGLYGAPDHLVEESAAREDAYEAGLIGG